MAGLRSEGQQLAHPSFFISLQRSFAEQTSPRWCTSKRVSSWPKNARVLEAQVVVADDHLTETAVTATTAITATVVPADQAIDGVAPAVAVAVVAVAAAAAIAQAVAVTAIVAITTTTMTTQKLTSQN